MDHDQDDIAGDPATVPEADAPPVTAPPAAGDGLDDATVGHDRDAASPASRGGTGGTAIGAPGPQVVVSRSRTSLLTWGTVAVVLVIVIVLIALKVTGSSSTSTSPAVPAPQAAPAAVVQAVTAIPASVYDTVGVTSSDAVVTPPTVLHGQPPLDVEGKPAVVFVGDEFCPYCAAQRWALVAALARFGKLSGLDSMQSGSDEAFNGTPTFTFADTHYSSDYVAAELFERYSDRKNGAGTAYSLLDPIPAADRTLLDKYGKTTSSTASGTLPFVDVGNRVVSAGGEFSPSVLQQLSASDIATGLTDPKAPATQAIVAAANYLSASICSVDGEQPVTVCTSKGVEAADAALQLAS